jgi:DNA-binding NarL/FixJ family response regulator
MEDKAIVIHETQAIDRVPQELSKLEKKQQFVKLRAQGLSYDKIAKELKVSKATLANWNQELEGEIARLKAIELESLYQEFFMAKEARIRRLGELSHNLKTELLSRDLSQIPTHKLLDLFLKCDKALQDEYVEVKPLSDQEIQELQEAGMAQMDSADIARELHRTFIRYKMGMITAQEADREKALLQAMLKAYEQGELEEKLDSIKATMLGREG